MYKPAIILLTILIFLFAFASASSAQYSGGSGTQEDPYQISTVADWQTLMNTSDDWNKHFILTADLDLKGIMLSPIGNGPKTFTGVFDGNGHIISNAVINMPESDYVGMFGYVDQNGQLCNIAVQDINITGRNAVGGLVGFFNSGRLDTCYATGSVSGNGCVGGLVGDNGGSLIACYAIGSVSGDDNVGGLVGLNFFGNLNACYASGLISGGKQSGGLVGGNLGGNLTACYATGSISGTEAVGGLVGYNYQGSLSACYAMSSVKTGGNAVGGLVGANWWGSITDCYTTGSVSGGAEVGGLVGFSHQSSLSACYATGLVSGNRNIGGLVGWNDGGSLTACFWDVESSGQTTSNGGMGKTTAEMKTRSTFTDAGWDFAGEMANGAVDTWSICEGTNYPRLTWQIPEADWLCPDGVGLEDFSYLTQFWMIPEGSNIPADLDKNNIVGISDLIIFCQQWLIGR
jgi:hypothetical protein